MINRRTLLAALTTAALLQSAPLAYAASPVEVEIIALGHWPVQNSLKPVREILEGFGDKIHVQEFDAEAADGIALIEGAGQHGHVPVLILINGEYQFTRADGSAIEFLSFPSGAENPLGVEGGWSVNDVEYIINNELGN